ncbi:hypothetical protein CJI97_004277 [Candidozyma auris]|nr:hypothetical protein CJI97_004277 [[Candida] auris]
MYSVKNGRKPPPELHAGSGIHHSTASASGAVTGQVVVDRSATSSEPPVGPDLMRPGSELRNVLSKDECRKIIHAELKALKTDTSLCGSVFDLIDHCSVLLEELQQTPSRSARLKTYIRAYLIYNYSINSFIMLHFGGFDFFVKKHYSDFIIYLNLYNFFRTDGIFDANKFDVKLADLRRYMDEYLVEKELLTFKIDHLYGWLDDYIEYLKHKDADEEGGDEEEDEYNEQEQHDQTITSSTVARPYYQTESANQFDLAGIVKNGETTSSVDKEISDFTHRFPEVSSDQYPQFSAPYPVSSSASQLPEPSFHNDHHPKRHTRNSYMTQPSLPTSSQPVPNCHSAEVSTPPKRITHPSSRQNQVSSASSYIAANSNNPSLVYGNNGNGFYQANMSYDLISQPHQRWNSQPQYKAPYMNGTHSMQQYMQQSHPFGNQPPQYINGQYRTPYSGANLVPYKAQTTMNLSVMEENYKAKQIERQQKNEWLRSLSICGLKNLGSSCYINSTIQVLFSVSRIVTLFSKRSSNTTLAKAMSLAKGSTKLTEAIVGLLSTFQSSGGSVISPTRFMRIVSSLKPDFNIPFEQQDAQEFLLFIIDKVHEELAREPTTDMLEIDYAHRWGVDVTPMEKEEYLKWYRALMKAEGVSPMNDLCQGHVRSQLICNDCHCTSNSYSSFSMLSLPIPNTGMPTVDLVECLRYYTQDEVLSGENAWKCPRCNKTEGGGNPMDVVFQQKRSFNPWKNKSPAKKSSKAQTNEKPNGGPVSIKKLSIIKLPPVLFIHLSRFSMFSVTDKLNAVISYPLRLKFNHQTNDVHYSLTGIINHFGTLKSGHYTALVNKSKDSSDRLVLPEWCYFDDENFRVNIAHGDVTSEKNNRVHSSNVYVLCYERQ